LDTRALGPTRREIVSPKNGRRSKSHRTTESTARFCESTGRAPAHFVLEIVEMESKMGWHVTEERASNISFTGLAFQGAFFGPRFRNSWPLRRAGSLRLTTCGRSAYLGNGIIARSGRRFPLGGWLRGIPPDGNGRKQRERGNFVWAKILNKSSPRAHPAPVLG
jgi:hypothetical protein